MYRYYYAGGKLFFRCMTTSLTIRPHLSSEHINPHKETMQIRNMENKAESSQTNGREEKSGGKELIDQFVSRDDRENGCVDLMTKLKIGAAIGELQKYSATSSTTESTNTMQPASCHTPSSSSYASFSNKGVVLGTPTHADAPAVSTRSSSHSRTGSVRSLRRSRSIDDTINQMSKSLYGQKKVGTPAHDASAPLSTRSSHSSSAAGNVGSLRRNHSSDDAINQMSKSLHGQKKVGTPAHDASAPLSTRISHSSSAAGNVGSLRRNHSSDDAIAKMMSKNLPGHKTKTRHFLGDRGDEALKGEIEPSHPRSMRSSNHDIKMIKGPAVATSTGRGRRKDKDARHSSPVGSGGKSERRAKSLGPRQKLRASHGEDRTNYVDKKIPGKKIKRQPFSRTLGHSSRDEKDDDQSLLSTKSEGPRNRRRGLGRSNSANGSDFIPHLDEDHDEEEEDQPPPLSMRSLGPSSRRSDTAAPRRGGTGSQASVQLKKSLTGDLGVLNGNHQRIHRHASAITPELSMTPPKSLRHRSFDSLIGSKKDGRAGNNHALRSDRLSKTNRLPKGKSQEGNNSKPRRSSSFNNISNGLRKKIGSDAASVSSSESDIESEGEDVDLPPRTRGKNATSIDNEGVLEIKASSYRKFAAVMRRTTIRDSLFKTSCLEDEEEPEEFLDFVKGASRITQSQH
jgi:hypothetical protein